MFDTQPRTGKFVVVIVDQFCGISPYALQKAAQQGTHLTLDDFKPGADYYESYCQRGYFTPRTPQVMQVDDNFAPQMATTVLRADDSGHMSIWKARWDSD